MKRMFRFARVLLLNGLFAASLAMFPGGLPYRSFAEESPVVTVATLSDYMPYCFLVEGAEEVAVENIPPGSDSVRFKGFSWDVVRESLHEMGYTIRLIVVPWERGMSYVRQGKADVLFPTAITDERLKTFIYSREIVNTARYIIYVPASRDIQWEGLESLRGRRIAVIRGWTYGKAWIEENEIQKEVLDGILQCFHMLDLGRVYGVAGYDIVFDYVLKKEGVADQYRKLPPFDRSDEYIAGARASPESRRILDDFDAGKRRIVQKGIYEAIEAKWR